MSYIFGKTLAAETWPSMLSITISTMDSLKISSAMVYKTSRMEFWELLIHYLPKILWKLVIRESCVLSDSSRDSILRLTKESWTMSWIIMNSERPMRKLNQTKSTHNLTSIRTCHPSIRSVLCIFSISWALSLPPWDSKATRQKKTRYRSILLSIKVSSVCIL